MEEAQAAAVCRILDRTVKKEFLGLIAEDYILLLQCSNQ